MIAVGVAARRIDMRVVGDELRRVLVSLGVEEGIEAIEAAPERAAAGRAGGPARHLGGRPRLARDLPAIAGIAGIEIGEAPDPDRMMVAPGEQRGARRR